MNVIDCRFTDGGPVNRQTFEHQGEPPEWAYFGSQGGFVYRLDPHAKPRARRGRRSALYRFDRQATREKLAMLGLPLHDVEAAVTSDLEALLQSSYTEGLRERPEIGGSEVDVRIELWADEWQVYVAGELVETVSRATIEPGDMEALKQLAEQVGRQFVTKQTEDA